MAILASLVALIVCGAQSGLRAGSAAIATVHLTPGWATFGEAVPQGVARDALQVGTLSTQTDVKTRWSDGSIRFAVVTANVTAEDDYAVTPAAAPAGSALLPALPNASVTLTIGGTPYTATLPIALSTNTWLAGPLVYEGRSVVKPTSLVDGSAQPFLRVIFDTRKYAGGNGRVDVTVENVLDQVGATTVTYDASISIDGTEVYSHAGVQHYYLTRWRKAFRIGSSPWSAVRPDISPFNVSRALPAYLPLVTDVVDRLDDPSYAFDILQRGALDVDMSEHSGRPALAPFPDWTARYLVNKNAEQLTFVLANGDLSGSWPIHVREPIGATTSGVGSGHLVSINQRPLLWIDKRAEGDFMQDGVRLPGGGISDLTPLDFIKGKPLPLREYTGAKPTAGESPLTPDNAHQPSLAYVPYLLTGDRYYADEMAFWANYGMLRTYPADGVRSDTGILENNEVRGYGWSLRNIADAAAYYPEAAVAAYFQEKVIANLQWLDDYAQGVSNPADSRFNPLHVMWTGYRPEPGFISLWEQTYLAYAIDRANQQGFIGGLQHRDAIAGLQLRLFTDADWPRVDANGAAWSAPYLLGVGVPGTCSTTTATGVVTSACWNGFTFFNTFAEVRAATTGAVDAHGVQLLQRDYAGFYGPEARMNLMMLKASGNAAAVEPYDYLYPFIAETKVGCADTTLGTRVDLDCRPGWALDSYPTAPPPVNTAPTFAPPADMTTTATSAAGAALSFTVANGVDAEDGPLTPSCSPASGSTFAIGTTPVTCTVTDSGGLWASASFNVIVVDAAPEFTSPADVVTTATSAAGAIVTYAPPTAADFKDVTVAVVCTPPPGTPFGIGTTVVTCIATNSSKMTTTRAFNVTVVNRLSKFVAFSDDMTWLQSNATVVSGDIGANGRNVRHPHDADDDDDRGTVTVRVGERVTLQQAGSRVVGDVVRLDDRASVYDVVYNTLKANGATILGSKTAAVAIPFLALPAMHEAAPGSVDVEVRKGATQTLAAGAYRTVHVATGATLILTGGVYQMRSLDVDASATVVFRSPAEIRIATELDTDNKAKMILDPAARGLTASDVVLYVGGSDAACGHDGRDAESGDNGSPAVAHVGENNILQANIYAPRGTIRIKSKTQATGAFVGGHIRVGQNVTLKLDSAFK